jgi:hypothetical protein
VEKAYGTLKGRPPADNQVTNKGAVYQVRSKCTVQCTVEEQPQLGSRYHKKKLFLSGGKKCTVEEKPPAG